jgi:hypothetical protein
MVARVVNAAAPQQTNQKTATSVRRRAGRQQVGTSGPPSASGDAPPRPARVLRGIDSWTSAARGALDGLLPQDARDILECVVWRNEELLMRAPTADALHAFGVCRNVHRIAKACPFLSDASLYMRNDRRSARAVQGGCRARQIGRSEAAHGAVRPPLRRVLR